MSNKSIKEIGFKYYCKGLNSKEIGKLLGVSYRTVQNWMSKENWKQKRNPPPIKTRALQLYNKGYSYNEIAEVFKVSRSTISQWIKEVRK